MLDLSKEELAIVQDILKRYIPQRTVWAFGSRVENSARKTSDLDLAILGEEPLNLTERARLVNGFDICSLNFKVDPVEWANANPQFREIISQNKHVIQHGKTE